MWGIEMELGLEECVPANLGEFNMLLSVEWLGIGNFSCGTTTMVAVPSLGKSYLILWLLFSFSGHTVQQCLCLSPCLYSKLCLGKIREVKLGVL